MVGTQAEAFRNYAGYSQELKVSKRPEIPNSMRVVALNKIREKRIEEGIEKRNYGNKEVKNKKQNFYKKILSKRLKPRKILKKATRPTIDLRKKDFREPIGSLYFNERGIEY